ncbi:MAG: polyprenyl diphosphate synthase [Phycisphaerae bacterium]
MPTMPSLDPLEVLGVPREAMPRHIAVIMDGNGRWARERNLPRIEGHRSGSEAVREMVTECARLGTECVTLYSFSVENWKRPRDEVEGLMGLYAQYLAQERRTIMDNDIRLLQIGRRDRLTADVLRELDLTARMSADNPGMTLCLALNYGSRTELVDACRRLAQRVARGELQAESIDEDLISASLYTAGLPDPDLLIRTGGEMRVSNFLLWQLSYAELYEALRSFAGRERRYGDVRSARSARAPSTTD